MRHLEGRAAGMSTLKLMYPKSWSRRIHFLKRRLLIVVHSCERDLISKRQAHLQGGLGWLLETTAHCEKRRTRVPQQGAPLTEDCLRKLVELEEHRQKLRDFCHERCDTTHTWSSGSSTDSNNDVSSSEDATKSSQTPS